MRIPFWQRDQAHPTKAIDRLQSNRSFRQIVGLQVLDDFSSVIGSLVRVRGTGKHARFKELSSFKVPIEDSARQFLVELKANPEPKEADIRFGSTELNFFQTSCFRSLISQSGVNKTEIIAVSVVDPGILVQDIDGQQSFRSLTDSTQLANQTSTTVIDRFRERDIADGGQGHPLFPLGYWFLLGDRDPKIAEENRLLLRHTNKAIEVIYLPASDGLDATIPAITHDRYSAQEFNQEPLQQLADRVKQLTSSLRLKIIWDETFKNEYEPVLANQSCFSSSLISDFGFCQETFSSVATAFLANAFIDQLPVSIPELTGNMNPRVLGSMTPGSLVNFRNFVLQISKVTPSIMKLRNAI